MNGSVTSGSAEREILDWMALLTSLLELPNDRTQLFGGWLARLVAWACGASAVTLGSAVLFSTKGWTAIARASDAGLVLLAHELVHVRQYQRLGVFRFLRIYLGEYFQGRLRGLSHRQAYLEISFEAEARRGETVAIRLLRDGALLRGHLPDPVERS